MHSIAPSHSITPVQASLDTGGTNYSISQSAQFTTSHHQNTDITIFTAEGDKVTLSSTSQFQATCATYNSFARTKGEFTWSRGQSLDLNISRELSILVDGDLDKQELKDINKAIKTIEKIMRDFLSGDIGNAVAKALRISKLESISSLEADLQFEQSISF